MTSLLKCTLPALCVAILFASGCRTPQIVTQLEKENYALESKIWELVSLLEQKQAELDTCRNELERIKSQSGQTSGKTARSSPPRELYAPTWPENASKSLQPSPPVGSSTEPFLLPEINVTPPARETSPDRALRGATPDSPSTNSSDDNAVNRPLLLAPSNSEVEPTPDVLPQETTQRASPLDSTLVIAPRSAIPISSRSNNTMTGVGQAKSVPVRLSLAQEFVTGRNYDGEPGDDGIAVLVQPLDSQGDVILEPAAISVVVVDPAVRGPAARIARWDLQPEEVKSYVVRRGDLTGFLLELPWPNRGPGHEELKVFVRYYLPDGSHLETQSDIRVSLAPPAS